jgi:phosphotransferase system enzyme I (PtsI)
MGSEGRDGGEVVLRGTPVSPGIAIAPAFVFGDILNEVEVRSIDPSDVDEEIEKLANAVALVREELARDADQISKALGQDKADVFLVHSMILEDPSVVETLTKKIREELMNAEAAVAEEMKRMVSVLSASEDSYLRDRAYDISDIGKRVIERILGVWAHCPLTQPMILVASELRASDTASMERGRILGFVTELGGPESHAAILARSMGVPAISGVAGILDRVGTGDVIVLDGEEGVAIVGPGGAVLEQYEGLRKERDRRRDLLAEIVDLPSVTADGTPVVLMANVNSVEEGREASRLRAEGVGLLRTELAFMGTGTFMDEEAQYAIYRDVAAAMGGRPVTIRTLDVGGDKFVGPENPLREHNPNLGYRSTRVLLDRPDLFLTQLRAIARAGADGNVRILLPMISSVDEVRRARQMLAEAIDQLRGKGVPFREDIPMGVMIEVPSAAMVADRLARECDYLSIGTNDLVQYALAVDRGSSYVSNLYRPHDPSVLELIARSLRGAAAAGKPVSLCGEMAGTEAYVPLLVGLGIRELSVSNSRLLSTKKAVRDVDVESATALAARALEASTAGEVEELLGGVRAS